MNDTKERILDVAERLFAEQGFASISLRHIIAEAGVNLAAVHYHFGSKEELMDELVRRRADPINQARIEWLTRLEADAGGKPLAVETIVQAFMEPSVHAALQHPAMMRCMSRFHAEELGHATMRKHFEPVARRFIAAMRDALPHLPEDEFLMRLRCAAGAMAFSILSEPCALPIDAETARRRIATLTAFLKGGLTAPAALAGEESAKPAGEKIEVEI